MKTTGLRQLDVTRETFLIRNTTHVYESQVNSSYLGKPESVRRLHCQPVPDDVGRDGVATSGCGHKRKMFEHELRPPTDMSKRVVFATQRDDEQGSIPVTWRRSGRVSYGVTPPERREMVVGVIPETKPDRVVTIQGGKISCTASDGVKYLTIILKAMARLLTPISFEKGIQIYRDRRVTGLYQVIACIVEVYGKLHPRNLHRIEITNGEFALKPQTPPNHPCDFKSCVGHLKGMGQLKKQQLNGNNGEVTNGDDLDSYTLKEKQDALHVVRGHFESMGITIGKKREQEAVIQFLEGKRLKNQGTHRSWTEQERQTFVHLAFEKLPNLTDAGASKFALKLFQEHLREAYEDFIRVDPNNYYAPLQEVDEVEAMGILGTPTTHPFLGVVEIPEVQNPIHPKHEPPEIRVSRKTRTYYTDSQLDAEDVYDGEEYKEGDPVMIHRKALDEVLYDVEKRGCLTDRKINGICSAKSVSSVRAKKTRGRHPLVRDLQNINLHQHDTHLLNGMPYFKVHSSYKTFVPKLGEEEDIEPSLPYHFPEFYMGEKVVKEKVNQQSSSLVSSKYALNAHGLFRLSDGQWVEMINSGGRARTFRGLGIEAVQAQRLPGKFKPLEDEGKDMLNLFVPSTEECVMINPIKEIENFTFSAMPYRWFAKLRLAAENYFTPGVLYNGYTEAKRTIYVHTPLLDKLRRKIAAATNELIYNTVFGLANENCSCPALALDTVLYFFEMKVLLQASAVATVDAHTTYSKQRWLHRSPVSGVGAGPFSETYNTSAEGKVVISTRDEVRSDHSRGITTVQREPYTACSFAYGSLDNPVKPPGGMLEPLNDMEHVAMKKRGVEFADPYIKFDYHENEVRDAWQSVGGGFATSVAVINHLSTRQCEMAHSRILFARGDETEQRYRASRYWDEVKNMFESICKAEDETWEKKSKEAMRELVAEIKNRDKQYQGGRRIYKTWGEEGNGNIDLPPQTMLQAFTQACIHHTMSDINIEHQDERVFDDTQALDDYIEEIGAKLPLRRELLDRIRSRMLKGVQSRVNLVQCKPHEFQKYKIIDGEPCLKYARDVVSITGEDWLAAKPHLIAYVKKSLEGKHTVRFLEENGQYLVSVEYEYTNSIGVSQMLHKYYLVPAKVRQLYEENLVMPLDRAFFYRSIITGTDLDSLGEVMTEIEQTVFDHPGSLYVITHGDDQLAATYNRDPHRYGGKIGVVYIEGDVNDNDGSHVDQFYRLDFLTFLKRGEKAIIPFAQLANPLFLCNPNDLTQYATLRRTHGMQMCSGSVHTTYGNSKMSMNVGLSLFFNPDLDYSDAARTIGMNVTSLTGGLSDVTFLSKNFYRDGHRISCYTDFASLLRKIGRATGDVNGKSAVPVDIRFDDHNEGIVKGWVHEPASKIVDMARQKYIIDRPHYVKVFKRYIKKPTVNLFSAATQIIQRDMSPVDCAAIRHYYPENFEQGLTDYANLLELMEKSDTFGTLIKSNFIDTIMKRRYGMIPVIR